MNKLIVNLNTDHKETKTSNKVSFLWNSTFSSGLGIVVLFGFFTFVFGSTLLFVGGTGGGVFAQKEQKNLASVSGSSLLEDQQEEIKIVLYKDPFEFIKIEGKAAYVFDVTSGEVLYEKNKNTVLPLASVTKLMTALTARKVLDENDVVTIRPEDISLEGSSGLMTGEKWNFSSLLDFTLVTSSNDGASAIAAAAGIKYQELTSSIIDMSPKEIFIEKMNETAKEIGMINTLYNNETGLDISNSISGGHGTVSDISLLYKYILQTYPEILEVTRQAELDMISLDEILHSAKNTNQRVASFSGILGSKTGYTDLAGGNLGIIFDSGLGSPIIVVVLGSSIDGRFEDVAILSDAARKAVTQELF